MFSSLSKVVSDQVSADTLTALRAKLERPGVLWTTALQGRLPKAKSDDLRDYIRDGVRSEGRAHLKSVFPVGSSLPETPTSWVPIPDCDATVSAMTAALIANSLVDHSLVSYKSENSGSLFVNIVALDNDGRQGKKSVDQLRGHTDAVAFPLPGHRDSKRADISPSPDYVCLMCLRNPHAVPTTIARLDLALDKLTPDQLQELQKPQFAVRAQSSFQDALDALNSESFYAEHVSVLTEVNGEYWVRLNSTGVVPMFEAEREGQNADDALTALRKACADVREEVQLNPGDILVINNRTCLHGRAALAKDFEHRELGGQSRWLLRTYGLRTTVVGSCKKHGSSSYMLYP